MLRCGISQLLLLEFGKLGSILYMFLCTFAKFHNAAVLTEGMRSIFVTLTWRK